jgi:5'-deoxynucleotidase YfbR-like HD superfamily hydrolase
MASKKQLNGMYKLLSRAYKCNWQYRWQDTPYLEEAIKNGRVESVVGHVWGTMELWFHLRKMCPKLDSLVDTTEVYEILLNHDLGETNVGDTPLYRKINGAKDSKQSERDDLEKISDSLPEVQSELLAWFDEFEQEIEKIDRLEILIAKWLDNLQGNHLALIFGNDLHNYSEPINKILQISFVVYTNRLVEVLKARNETDAMDEVKQVAQHHADAIKAAGIDFDTSKLKI